MRTLTWIVVLAAVLVMGAGFPSPASAGPATYLCKQDAPNDCREYNVAAPAARAASTNWTRWHKDTWQKNIGYCKKTVANEQVDSVPCVTVLNLAAACESHAKGTAKLGDRFASYCAQYGLNGEWQDPDRPCTQEDYDTRVPISWFGSNAVYRQRLAFAQFLQRSHEIPIKNLGNLYSDLQPIYDEFAKNGRLNCKEIQSRADHLLAMLSARLGGKNELREVARFIAELYAEDILLPHVQGIFKHLSQSALVQLRTASKSQRVNILLEEYESSPFDYLLDAVPSLKACGGKRMRSVKECIENLEQYAGTGQKYYQYVNRRGGAGERDIIAIIEGFPQYMDAANLLKYEIVWVLDLCNPNPGLIASAVKNIREECKG